MKVKKVLFVLATVCLCLLFVPFQGRVSEAQVPALSNSETIDTNLFAVLDHLGPWIYEGVMPDGRQLTVHWQNQNITTLINGVPVLGQLVEEYPNSIIIHGILPETPANALEHVRVFLTMNVAGNLLINLSDWEGYDSQTLHLNSETGELVLATKCTCYGGGKGTKRRKCKTTECDDPAACSTQPGAPTAYCKEMPVAMDLP